MRMKLVIIDLLGRMVFTLILEVMLVLGVFSGVSSSLNKVSVHSFA